MDVKRVGGGGGSGELSVDVKEKRSNIVVCYLAKSFTARLETSEFHDSDILIFFNDFRWCSYSCKAAEQLP